MKNLQPQQVSTDVLIEKYAKDGETTHSEIFARVAKGIAQAESTPELKAHWTAQFLANMERGAIGAGRIMSAAGTDIQATLANCFVQPVGDAIQGLDSDGKPGIYDALRQAAETMRRGGGVGYDFSAIRPKGARVKGTHSEASGPCSYIDVFDASCRTVESAGARRGAQMGILSIEHPDIQEFITAKRTPGRWNNFNVSIGMTDAFMCAVQGDLEWQLCHKAPPHKDAKPLPNGKYLYRSVRARDLWQVVMKSTYDFAEPGIVFLDRMNQDNNLHYAETIAATNPCGEQPLPAYGCCDLGPIDLTRFVVDAFLPTAHFDEASFAQAVAVQVRFLDNVLDVTFWPLDEQRIEAQNKRRIGVGFTGLGNALAMIGKRYNTKEGCEAATRIAQLMRDSAYQASVDLAAEKGPFPLFNAEKFLAEGTFASRLPEAIKKQIKAKGLRNSHLLSIAPTGTVSLAFSDNASNGIEPPFSLAYTRKKRTKDGGFAHYPVLDHALRVFLETVCKPELREPLLEALCNGHSSFQAHGETHTVKNVLPAAMVTALEMSADEHLAMMAAVQPFVDSSISKTVNVPQDYPFEDFVGLYHSAWKAGLKGLATYRPNDILGAVLTAPSAPAPAPAAAPAPVAAAPADIDPVKMVFEKRPEGDFHAVNSRIEYITSAGSKSMYLSVSFADVEGVIDGQKFTIERPIEIFIPGGQIDVAAEWVSSFARQLSLNARSGFLARALKDARQVKSDRGQVRYGWYEKADGSKVPRFHDSEVGAIAFAIQQILFKRGYLDENGNQVPAKKMISKARHAEPEQAELPLAPVVTSGNSVLAGKECGECGAHAVIKKDGCDFCTNCSALGSCG